MLNDFQSTVEEKKKRKLTLLPTTDDAFTGDSWNITAPIKKQAPMTPGDPNNEAFYSGSNPLRNINSRPDRVGQGTRVVERNMLPSINTLQPESSKIKEVPDARRDAELGKMTVSTEGDIVTYNIGGNTLSYNRNDNDRQNKTNLERINSNGSQRVGNLDITVDPSVPINERGRGLGNMMGPAGTPTWDDYHKQQQARYDAYANAQKGRFFGATPLESEQPVDNSIGGMFVRGLQSKKDRSDAQIINAEADRDMNRANFLSTLDRNQIARDQLSLDADKNRIDEQGVIAENKLRGIQGDVLQNPPIKENPLKPLVIEEPDPNDPTGMAKRQVIKMPNAEGTGYVDNMPTATTTPQVTPEQRTKINALIKANPNITREAILQKIANGEI